ncbi:MAG: zinc ribbon domain-containing protein [Ruminococcus sp.]|nr:zinc ribbon domain-containing protein [Ruminococcus sp.]
MKIYDAEVESMFCTNCGKEVYDNTIFCEHCGARIAAENPYPTAVPPKNDKPKKSPLLWVIVVLLVILIAAVGIVGFLYFKNENEKDDERDSSSVSEVEATEDETEAEETEAETTEAEAQTTTAATTVAATTAEPTTEPVVIDYSLYDDLIDYAYEEMVEMGVTYTYSEFYLFDADQDGVDELILKAGTCEADTIYEFYTIEDGEIVDLGSISGSHSSLAVDGDTLYTNKAYMGTQEIGMVVIDAYGVYTDVIYSGESLTEYREIGETLSTYKVLNVEAEEVIEEDVGDGIMAIDGWRGQINCHGTTVPGYTTDYICYGGSYETVRKSLGDTWHITAMNVYTSNGTTWYELWDTDDGDYYGWVDSYYIDFY